MSFEVLAATVARALREPDHSVVKFIWHGGEPTVLPKSFYEKAVLLQSRFRQPGQIIRNSIQTNGTRIDDDWARFLRRNEFEVSISIDGPPSIHDRTRRYASGRSSFADVMAGLRKLRGYGFRPGVLMVIDREALALGPDAIFEFFVEHDIRSYGLLAAKPVNLPGAQPGTPVGHYVTPREMNQFLIGYFDRWLAHGDPDIHVREFSGLLRRVAGNRPNLCTLAGNCFGRFYLVESNGDVAHCDVFVGDPAYNLGNVLTDSFATLRCGESLQGLQMAHEQVLGQLRACPEFNVCNGWCPHELYISSRHDPNFDGSCCGLRELIEHIRRRTTPSTRKGAPDCSVVEVVP